MSPLCYHNESNELSKRYPFKEPLSLELNFSFPLEHVTELIVLGERMFSVAVDKFGVVGKKLEWITFLSSK